MRPRRPSCLLPPCRLPTSKFRDLKSMRRFPRERWLWVIPIVLALLIAGFMLYQRRVPSPDAPIALHAVAEAQSVQLAWNTDSAAIRGAQRAEINIDDGGKSSLISLTRGQLQAGKISYLPQSSDVGFAMTVFPAGGDPIHDSTRLIAPVFAVPTEPPQLIPPNPATENSALEQQVRDFPDDLARERARADKLQNLVRILEKRLGVKSKTPQTESQP